jgi:hypothetical protein
MQKLSKERLAGVIIWERFFKLSNRHLVDGF